MFLRRTDLLSVPIGFGTSLDPTGRLHVVLKPLQGLVGTVNTLLKPKEPEIALSTTNPVAKPTGNGGLPGPCLSGAAQSSVASNNHPGGALEPSCPVRGILGRDRRRRKT